MYPAQKWRRLVLKDDDLAEPSFLLESFPGNEDDDEDRNVCSSANGLKYVWFDGTA